jgi:hypothetical protein
MTNYRQIIATLRSELLLSLDHLEYSFAKIKKNNWPTDSKDLEILESFEALVSRFSRVTDIFISKYLRSLAEQDDPAFRGSLRDWVNYAEKRGTIESALFWMEVRELRNKIAHEYANNDLAIIFEQVLKMAPEVLRIRKQLI